MLFSSLGVWSTISLLPVKPRRGQLTMIKEKINRILTIRAIKVNIILVSSQTLDRL